MEPPDDPGMRKALAYGIAGALLLLTLVHTCVGTETAARSAVPLTAEDLGRAARLVGG